ncbi:hypothetical protein ACVII1_006307 [Bradyrhizobium elkanii]
MPPPYTNPQYFFKSSSTDRRVVVYYKPPVDVTKVWDDKNPNQPHGQGAGDQLNAMCFQLEQQNFQKDSNAKWPYPNKP